MVFSGCLRRQRSFDMEPAQGRQVSTALLVGGKLLFQFQKRRRIVLNHPFLLPLGVGGVNRIALPAKSNPIRPNIPRDVEWWKTGWFQMSHRETFDIPLRRRRLRIRLWVAGHWPLPPGDPPGGAGIAPKPKKDGPLGRDRLDLPVGESSRKLSGAGRPCYPFSEHALKPN